MHLLFLSDFHDEEEHFNNIVQQLEQKQFDIIILGGDFANSLIPEMNFEEQIQIQRNILTKYTNLLYEKFKKPIYYILGNHESEACVYETENIHYIGNKSVQLGEYKLIGLSGASSSLVYEHQNINYLGGYPFLPSKIQLLNEKNNEFINNNEPFLKQLIHLEEQKSIEKDRLNLIHIAEDQQYLDALKIVGSLEDKQKLIIMSHQGPISSFTTFYTKKDKKAASGSLGLELLRRQLKDRIKLWAHGHTHNPHSLQDGEVIICGLVCKGQYKIAEV
ncbi:Calcineurin-like_phosphoesterase superfamily domain-containing protein [Hexamita inflata]|uniref:Calcineurin-like phosphoesterase superfamily domain-containing protein n=1 Tax=Hexamita inflata TaxID=28002 RepID=A0AA86UEA0_9EUKA|nr:Calcineurin-like phosphoesterase superfamily domain-containing protein [Hexamita inflata]CAI9954715.1 Calcineurin-like phosphoesterase superfamily domain-containing protein [Hexamita inflata]